MALEVHTLRDAVQPAVLIADRRLYLTADRAFLGDADGREAFLLASQGTEIPTAEVQRLSLGVVDGRIVVLASPAPPSHDDADAKARPAPADKARRKGADK